MLQATLRPLLVSKSLQARGFEWSLKNVSWDTLPTTPTHALAGGGRKGGGEKQEEKEQDEGAEEEEEGAEPSANVALAGRYRLDLSAFLFL